MRDIENVSRTMCTFRGIGALSFETPAKLLILFNCVLGQR